MSDDNKQLNPEEVKAKVLEEYGLEENEDNEALIEKLTTKGIEHQKELSKAIDKKAAYRQIGVEAGILDPKTFEPIEKKPDGKTFNKPTESADLGVRTVLKLQEKGFDARAINAIAEEASKLGVTVEKLADNDTWVSGFKTKVEAEKQKDEVSGATPQAGGRIITSDNKTFKDVVTNPNASEAEKQAAFEAQKKNLLGK